MTNYKRVVCRHAEIEDLLELDAIQDLVKYANVVATWWFTGKKIPLHKLCRCRSRDGTCGLASQTPLSTVLAYATLCVTATEPESGNVVGCIGFFASELVDYVLPTDDQALGVWVKAQAQNLRIQAPAGFVVPYFILHPDYEEAAFAGILGFAFSVSPSLARVLLVGPKAVPLSQPYILSYCTSVNPAGPHGATAYKATRAGICPVLNTRVAKVEDSDDLLPIVDGAQLQYGSLAKASSPLPAAIHRPDLPQSPSSQLHIVHVYVTAALLLLCHVAASPCIVTQQTSLSSPARLISRARVLCLHVVIDVSVYVSLH